MPMKLLDIKKHYFFDFCILSALSTAKLLFKELELMMQDKKNHLEYYEGAYERLIEKNVPFHALDISGLKWTEIDTKDDFIKAEKIFNVQCPVPPGGTSC